MGMIKSKLKRRLRKKYHFGEFQEFGFEIFTEFIANLSEEDFDEFVDDFIDEIEGHKLFFGGGGDSKKWEGFVTSGKKHDSPTIEQKEAIRKWLENRSDVEYAKTGELKDAWND